MESECEKERCLMLGWKSGDGVKMAWMRGVWDGNCEIVPILMDLLAICPVLKLLQNFRKIKKQNFTKNKNS